MEAVTKELASKQAKDGDPLDRQLNEKHRAYLKRATELADVENRYREAR